MDSNANGSAKQYRSFVARVLIAIGLVAVAVAAWEVREAILLAFAAVIVAVILLSVSGPVERLTGLAHRWSVIAIVILFVVVIALFGWLVGSQVSSQISQLFGQLPQALGTLEQETGISIPSLTELRQQMGSQSLLSGVFGRLAAWGWATFAALASLLVVVVAGVFLALRPEPYRTGLISLFPPRVRDQADAGLMDCGRALRLWLMGQLISMVSVALLVGLGTWAIGLPNPLALAVIAGLLEFIPMLGPILGAIPALLLALTQGVSTLLWTLVLFLAIQQLESNVIMPQVEREMVRIPPALFLFSVIAFGILFGILGVILAAPLTVVAYVAVQRFYVREALDGMERREQSARRRVASK